MNIESRILGLNGDGASPPARKPRPKHRKVSTQPTYLRLPDALREAVDAFCEQEAVNMTTGIQTLLKQALALRHLWPPHPTNSKPLPGIE